MPEYASTELYPFEVAVQEAEKAYSLVKNRKNSHPLKAQRKADLVSAQKALIAAQSMHDPLAMGNLTPIDSPSRGYNNELGANADADVPAFSLESNPNNGPTDAYTTPPPITPLLPAVTITQGGKIATNGQSDSDSHSGLATISHRSGGFIFPSFIRPEASCSNTAAPLSLEADSKEHFPNDKDTTLCIDPTLLCLRPSTTTPLDQNAASNASEDTPVKANTTLKDAQPASEDTPVKERAELSTVGSRGDQDAQPEGTQPALSQTKSEDAQPPGAMPGPSVDPLTDALYTMAHSHKRSRESDSESDDEQDNSPVNKKPKPATQLKGKSKAKGTLAKEKLEEERDYDYLSDEEREKFDKRGAKAIRNFLFRGKDIPPSISTMARKHQKYLPLAATHSPLLAMAFFRTTHQNFLCLLHLKNHHAGKVDSIMGLTGIPSSRRMDEQRHLRFLHCGCALDDSLHLFYLWKTFVTKSKRENLSAVDFYMDLKGINPRIRHYWTQSLWDATKISVYSLYSHSIVTLDYPLRQTIQEDDNRMRRLKAIQRDCRENGISFDIKFDTYADSKKFAIANCIELPPRDDQDPTLDPTDLTLGPGLIFFNDDITNELASKVLAHEAEKIVATRWGGS